MHRRRKKMKSKFDLGTPLLLESWNVFCTTKNERIKKKHIKSGAGDTRARSISPTARAWFFFFFLNLNCACTDFVAAFFCPLHSLCEHVNYYNGTFVLASTINAHNKLFEPGMMKMQSLLSLANHVQKKGKTNSIHFVHFGHTHSSIYSFEFNSTSLANSYWHLVEARAPVRGCVGSCECVSVFSFALQNKSKYHIHDKDTPQRWRFNAEHNIRERIRL